MRRTVALTDSEQTSIEAECERDGAGSPRLVTDTRWKIGLETPTLLQSNPAAVELCQSILDGTAVELPPLAVSEAVAVQVYRLVVKDKALSSSSIGDVYVILSSLHHGRIAAHDRDAAKRLQIILCRKRSDAYPGGLGVLLAWRVKNRHKDGALKGMSPEEAEQHLLRQWDQRLLSFNFGSPAGYSGGGGGDPSGDPSGDPTAEQATAAAASADAPRLFDIRTRTMEAAIALRAVGGAAERSRRGWSLSWWRQLGGALPDDALRIIDSYVRSTRLSQARREETFELKLIRTREQLDEVRREKEVLEARVRAADLEALRATRQRDSAETEAAARLEAAQWEAQDTLTKEKRQHGERMRLANAGYLERRKELMAERMVAEDQVTRVQAENSELEKQLNRARAALRASTKEQAATLAQLEAELQRAREGRVWARVREEEVRRGRAEQESARLQHEVDRLLSEASGRSRERASEKQELRYLRHRVKELEKKVRIPPIRYLLPPSPPPSPRLRGPDI